MGQGLLRQDFTLLKDSVKCKAAQGRYAVPAQLDRRGPAPRAFDTITNSVKSIPIFGGFDLLDQLPLANEETKGRFTAQETGKACQPIRGQFFRVNNA